jgi:predicted nuclease with TOPRIM domain
MEKNQTLTEEELNQLREFQTKNNEILNTLGQIEVQKAILEGNSTSLLSEMADLREKQNKMSKELQEKYGDGNINLDTGEFTKS